MFTPYPYKKSGEEKGVPQVDDFIKAIQFTFDCRFNYRYMVRLEEYPSKVFMIKFHLRRDKNNNNRYKLLTGFHDASRVIGTCIHIALDFWKEKVPDASFGLIGVWSVGEDESKSSKRYHLYVRVLQAKFSPVHFLHQDIPSKSAYFMISRKMDAKELSAAIEEKIANLDLGQQ